MQSNYERFWYISAFLLWVLFVYIGLKSPSYNVYNPEYDADNTMADGGSWGR